VDKNVVSVHGDQMPESRPFYVPGDISSAAFWMVAAAAQPGAHLVISDVGLNNTRTGINSVLLRMGASIREIIEDVGQSEPYGKIEIHGGSLHGTTIENTETNAEIPRLIDEIPVLAVAAALAQGTTTFKDISELRVKESDRVAAIISNLRAMGARVEEGIEQEEETGRQREYIRIHGGLPLHGARLESFGDHRIAMAFCVAGMFAEGETIIDDTDCIKTSYPNFEETLYELMRPRGVRTYETNVISDVKALDLDDSPKGFFG
jgi:3-phosphoshikimate 1-carboxyvinyltransferase